MRTGTHAKVNVHSSVDLSAVSHKKDSPIDAVLSSNQAPEHSSLDGLRFKLIARGERHYFTDVRFSSEFVKTSDMLAVTTLLGGQCLEELNTDFVAAVLGDSPCCNEIQNLISELQAVLCV